MADWLAPNAIVYWGDSSEPHAVICVCMTGAGPAVWIQGQASGHFVSIQPDEIEDISPTLPGR